MTAYVERVNLTLREHIAPLSRRTWSLASDLHALWLHIEWGRAYYHFCRVRLLTVEGVLQEKHI